MTAAEIVMLNMATNDLPTGELPFSYQLLLIGCLACACYIFYLWVRWNK